MRCTEPRFSATYEAVHRYDGAVIQRGRREALVPCTVQPRDVAIVRDVRRYKFLTAPQLRELWWPERSVQAADRRLLKLFRAGYLDRFRPISHRGSFPWTYQLGLEGHRLLQRAGLLGSRERFVAREVYDYGHVLHDLQLSAWVLAYRRAAGDLLLSWEGETHIEPPREARAQQGLLRVGDHWSAEGLRDPRARLVRPDAVLEVARPNGDGSRVFFIEYDRTRRVDKNYESPLRYPSLPTLTQLLRPRTKQTVLRGSHCSPWRPDCRQHAHGRREESAARRQVSSARLARPAASLRRRRPWTAPQS